MTPVHMKKNYWQNRQKSSESAEKNTIPEAPVEQEVKLSESSSTTTSPSVTENKKKEEVTPTEKSVTPPTEETPKRKPEKKSKGFNLSDLGDLVTKTVTHNNNIPKTDISAAVSSGSVEVVLNQSYRRTQSPCPARAVDNRDRNVDTWRPLGKKPEGEVGPSWRAADTPAAAAAAAAADVLAEDPERTKALQEAESKALSTGHQIQYAIEKLQKQSRNKSVSESSSRSVKEEDAGGQDAWYDEEDEDQIDCFDLTI